MRARRCFRGVAGIGAVLGLALLGCGSSESKGAADAAANDGSGDVACLPKAVNATDSGACTACVASMCTSQLIACNADCTCGSAVNTLGSCLASIPSAEAGGGGLGAILGPGGLALFVCLMPLLPAAGQGGAPVVAAAEQAQ